MIPNYYKILNIEFGASKSEIKRAYRLLALRNHPDVNNSVDAHTIFIEINEAYLILSDDEARSKYDKEYYLLYNSNSKTEKDKYFKSEKDAPFEDEILNKWVKNAKKQANKYSEMKFSDFSKLVYDMVKETGFQLGNAIINMAGALFLTSGIANIIFSFSSSKDIGNITLGIFLTLIGIIILYFATNLTHK